MKPITMAIGIEDEEGACAYGICGHGICKEKRFCHKECRGKVGRSAMMQVLDESINTGVIFVERLVK